jgi:sarcosine oxidase
LEGLILNRSYDFIVLGCGGLGSAAVYWLSRQAGDRVLGLEQFRLGHENGASQDHSRIIRLSYDDPAYASLTPFTYIAWKELEAESGIQLVFQTGGIVFGPGDMGDASEIKLYAAAMRRQGIPFETLSAAETMRRFPQFFLRADDEVLYQAYSGFVDPRKANAVHITLARGRGASVMDEIKVEQIEPDNDGVLLKTSDGNFQCKRLIVTAGGWTNKVLGSVGIYLPLTITEEQVTYFATPHLRDFSPERFPVWIWHGEEVFYGFPVYGEVATKAGQDLGGDVVTVDTRKFVPNPRPLEKLQKFLVERIPDFLGPPLYTKPCIYTMPPDRGFVIDCVPGFPQISVAIGAGHAFKFASLIGHILSELAVEGRSNYDLTAFSLSRPAITNPNFVPLLKRSKSQN